MRLVCGIDFCAVIDGLIGGTCVPKKPKILSGMHLGEIDWLLQRSVLRLRQYSGCCWSCVFQPCASLHHDRIKIVGFHFATVDCGDPVLAFLEPGGPPFQVIRCVQVIQRIDQESTVFGAQFLGLFEKIVYGLMNGLCFKI